ncbi:MAG: hypothetical protein JRH15_15535 [Deltaproteobacteria bacterium]|nr:hypothetical protein [Deltaproteobacteria bacterium]
MFVGRANELRSIKTIINADRPTIGVVYGRRRIGKSKLIMEAFEGQRALIFEGLENRPKKEQISNFLFQLFYQTRRDMQAPQAKTWREAFIFLYEELKENPAHVVLDEFQWMANYRHEIVSELKQVWDLYLSRIKGITLVLCGSIASFMVKKVVRSSALYGRTDLEIHLKGFKLTEAKTMLSEKGSREVIEAMMLIGGVPKYLELIKEQPSVRLGINSLAFTDTGYLTKEYERIFLSHFGKNPDFEKIITLLAKNPYGLYRQQISEQAKTDLGGGLSRHLWDLEMAGFISSATPFHKKPNSRLIKYHLSDPYLRFYYAFIQPNLKKIKSGVHKEIFSKISQSGAFSAWMGRAFEYLCMDHAARITEILGFSGIDFSFGPYFRAPKKSAPGVQIDLLFNRSDHVITLCEMKYSLNSIGTDIIAHVQRKADLMQKQYPKRTVQKVLITRSDPTKELAHSGFFYKVIRPEEFF